MANDQVPVGVIGTGLMGTACARRVEAWRDKNHPNRKRRKKQEDTAVQQ